MSKQWRSPIEEIIQTVENQYEENLFKSIQKVEIVVDREELIKALAYDRDQYEKGYADGMRDAVDKLRAIMYHKAFEEDSDMQKWDSGCWIRYKMFENALKEVQQ